MRIESKVWGNTTEIEKNPFCELHRIEAKKGGVCSRHIHQLKYNLFFVESGQLLIRQFRENGMTDETILHAGDCMVCPPNEQHQFEALEDTVAFELYYPQQIGPVDIVRETQGYMKDDKHSS